MTSPPDDINLDLVPNDDDDDPDRQAAVRAAIIMLAKAHGITVEEEPGAIQPDAQENPERAAQLREKTNADLVDATGAFRKEEEIRERQSPDGTIDRRIHRIVEGRAKLGVSLKALSDLVDKCTYGIGAGVSLACKLVNWVREKISSRKR